MEFKKSSYVGNLGFEKMILVGNLSWAVSTWEKTGQKPITNPRVNVHPGVSILSAQYASIRQTV